MQISCTPYSLTKIFSGKCMPDVQENTLFWGKGDSHVKVMKTRKK